LTSDLGRHTLREAITEVRVDRPFSIVAIVLLPEHIHSVWTLPPGDDNYSTRWRRIKGRFTRTGKGVITDIGQRKRGKSVMSLFLPAGTRRRTPPTRERQYAYGQDGPRRRQRHVLLSVEYVTLQSEELVGPVRGEDDGD